MTTTEHQAPTTLANKLGKVAHVSPLLRKAMDVSGCLEERVGEWLLKCAVLRGANHYARDFGPDLPDDNQQLSDEEVGVALCLGNHPYNSAFIRAAAQLLSSDRVDPVRLTRLAVMERVETVLLHIASVAERFAPTAQPWAYLRENLHERKPHSTDDLPHWSRFVSQTGVTPFGGGPDIKWLWRGKPKA